MTGSFSIQQILKNNYGFEVEALSLLPLGADLKASIYKAQTKDESYFVKIKQGRHPDISVSITNLLHSAGISHIIPPVQTRDGQSIQYVDDFTLIVYPFIDGQNGFEISLSDDQWIILGKTLKQIHEIDVPASIQAQLRLETYSPKWREIVRQLFIHHVVHEEVAVNLMQFMKEHKDSIFKLVHQAEILAEKLKNQSLPFVLCHSDIHGGNVLINDNLYIIDWDEPMVAPKERDLMFIGGGVANVWNNSHEIDLFYQGYGSTQMNREALSYYRHERIVQDIAEYGQELLWKETGGSSRQEMFQHFTAMFEPNGVVDIAFRTGRE